MQESIEHALEKTMFASRWLLAPFYLGLVFGIVLLLYAFGLEMVHLVTDVLAGKGNVVIGILVAFLAGLGAIFFQMPALSLAVSAMFVLLMSGLILYETSNIINGGETNYIMATVTLFVAIFNLFTSLLHLLGFASND